MHRSARLHAALATAAGLLLGACTGGSDTAAPPPSTPTPDASPPVSPSTAPSPSPTAVDYGGEDVVWPAVARTTPAPPALGAVATAGHVALAGGGTLAPGLTLPRVGGTPSRPTVLTPCGRQVTVRAGAFRAVPPRRTGERLVVVDPGHGGQEHGTLAPDGTRESTRVLQIADLVRDDLAPRVDRVVMTRTGDVETTLQFRVALADALRASVAVSVHLNAAPETTRRYPGTSVYGALSDPNGRRVAGVLYESVRHYLEPLAAQVGGVWAANRDSAALYRRGAHGDYYYLLRRAHVTWAIVESLYLTRPQEARLVARFDVRAGLAGAISAGVLAFLTTREPGSGWRVPIPRPPDPPPAPSTEACHDPS